MTYKGFKKAAITASLAGGVFLLLCAPAWAVWPGPDWAVSFSRTYGGDQRVQAAWADNSGNSYCVYLRDSVELHFVHFGSAGSILKDLVLERGAGTIRRMQVDGSGDIVVFGSVPNGSYTDFYLAKYDGTTGAFKPGWPQSYNRGSPAVLNPGDVTADASGNVICTGYFNSGSTDDGICVKFNASGGYQWSVELDYAPTTVYDRFFGVATDPAGNVFVAASSDWGGVVYSAIFAYDPGGTYLSEDWFTVTDPDPGGWLTTDDNARALIYANGSLWMSLHGKDGSTMTYVIAANRIDADWTVWDGWGGGSQGFGRIWLPGGYRAFAGGIAVHGTGTVYVAGYRNTLSTPGDPDMYLAQFKVKNIGQWFNAGFTVTRDFGGFDAYGDPFAVAAAGTDASGNAYLAGAVTPSSCLRGEQDAMASQYNSAGALQWTKRNDHAPILNVLGVVLDGAGNEYVGLDSGENPVMLQYDSSGVLLNENHPNVSPNCRGRAGGIATDGTLAYISVGAINPTTQAKEVRIIGFSSSGVQSASYTYAGHPGIRAGPLAIDGSGNIYMAGAWDNAGSDDLLVLRMLSGGSLDWATPLNEVGADNPVGVAVDGTGVYVLQTDTDASPAGYLLTKLDLAGAKLWTRTRAGLSGREAEAFGLTPSAGGVLVAGTETDVPGSSWGRVLAFDGDGNGIGDRSYDGGQDAGFRGLTVSPSGAVYVAGKLGPAGLGDFDMHALSYGAEGIQRWATTYDTGVREDAASALALGDGSLYLAGEGSTTAWLMRYTEPPTALLRSAISLSTTSAPPGITVEVVLTVTNVGSGGALNMTPLLEINFGDSSVTLDSGPLPGGPLDILSGNSASFTWTFSAVGGGLVGLTASATGTDSGLGCPLLADESAQFKVLRRAKLLCALALSSSSAYIGNLFTVTLTATNDGDYASAGVVVDIEANSGSGLANLAAGPVPPGPLDILPESVTSFVWTFSVVGEGTLCLTATVTGSDGVSGSTSDSRSTCITLVGMAQLSATLLAVPSFVFRGEEIQLVMSVTNTGTAAALGVTPSLELNYGGGILLPVSGPSPPGPLDLAPGEAAAFAWTYSATAEGSFRFTATVTGTDSGMGGGSVAAAGSQTAGVLHKASFSATLLGPTEIRYVGEWITFTLTVTNLGEVDATNVLPAAQLDFGESLVTLIAEPCYTCPVTLSPGSSTLFVWTYSVTGGGLLSFTATVTGEDGGGGTLQFADSAGATLYMPATLVSSMKITPLTPAGEIGIGQWFKVYFTVTNIGSIPANSVQASISPLISPLTTIIPPLPLGTFTLGPSSATTFVWTFSAAGAGVLNYSATATGVDSGTLGPILTNSWGSVTIIVPARLSFPGPITVFPAVPRQGQTFTVTLPVTNVGQLVAEDASVNLGPVLGQGETSPISLQAGPLPAGPQTITPGQTVNFTWSYLALKSTDDLVLSATAFGTDELSRRLVFSITISGTVIIEPAALLLLTPATVPPGQTQIAVGKPLDISLRVRNGGDIGGLNLVPALALAGTGRAHVVSGPVPPGPLDLASGEETAFAWRLGTDRVGELILSFTVTGLEELPTGRPVEAYAYLKVLLVAPFAEEMVIYPNPVRSVGALPGCAAGDCFNIVPKLDADASQVEVDVYDAAMHRVYRETFSPVARGSAMTVRGVGEWAPGIYLVRVRARLVSGQEQEFPVEKVVIKR